MGKKLLRVSGISAIISVVIFAFNFYFFHFVTDEGFTLTYHAEAGKPFVSDLIGQLGVHFLFLSLASLLIALICFPKKEK